MRQTALLTALIFLTPSVVTAHPGHGSAAVQEGVLHYVANPSHAAVWLPGLVAVIAAIGFLRARRDRLRRRATSNAA